MRVSIKLTCAQKICKEKSSSHDVLIACYQNNGSNCTISYPEFLDILIIVVTLQISIFICCQLIDPCFQAIYFIVLPHAVCGLIGKNQKRLKEPKRTTRQDDRHATKRSSFQFRSSEEK